jgi:hypothetical protein
MKKWRMAARRGFIVCGFYLMFCPGSVSALDYRYILFHSDESNYTAAINGVVSTFPESPAGNIRAGVGITFNCLNYSDPGIVANALSGALSLAQTKSVPVLICFDVEQWLGGHPELWNWFDSTSDGYDTLNANNVEWFGWSSKQAIKISWRNWGGQTRVLPAPNLLSPEYRALIHAQFDQYIPILINWYDALPADKKYLFAGLKVGWESSIGTTNAVYHPNGNYYYETWPKDKSHDPAWCYNGTPPNYGFQQIGYAALTAGKIKTSGDITESDLCAAIHAHLDDLTARALNLGIPRAKIMTHVQPGWETGALEYNASYTPSSNPGFSCYGFPDIRNDLLNRVGWAIIHSLAKGAAGWGIAETGVSNDYNFMYALLHKGFAADPTCRLVNFYNWNEVPGKPNAILAVKNVLAEPTVGGGDTNALANSGFETPATGAYSNPTVSGWAFNGACGVQHNGSVWGAPNAPEGTQTAYLQGFSGNGWLGSIYQDVHLKSGTYTISFQAAQRSGQIQPILVSVDGLPVGTFAPASNNFAKITAEPFTVSAGIHTIVMAATDNTGDKTTFIDNVTIESGTTDMQRPTQFRDKKPDNFVITVNNWRVLVGGTTTAIIVTDIRGRTVRTIRTGKAAGTAVIQLKDLPTGLLFLRLFDSRGAYTIHKVLNIR